MCVCGCVRVCVSVTACSRDWPCAHEAGSRSSEGCPEEPWPGSSLITLQSSISIPPTAQLLFSLSAVLSLLTSLPLLWISSPRLDGFVLPQTESQFLPSRLPAVLLDVCSGFCLWSLKHLMCLLSSKLLSRDVN